VEEPAVEGCERERVSRKNERIVQKEWQNVSKGARYLRARSARKHYLRAIGTK